MGTLFLSPWLHAGVLELTDTDDVIRITLSGKPVLEYVKTDKPVPEGMDPAYRRSGYIHPVFTPDGVEATGDFAPDHPHQHGLFFAWTRTKYEGKKVDFWNLVKKLGRVEHRGVKALTRKDDRVSFSVEHAFVVGEGDAREDALKETWTVTVHKTPADHFLFDIESVQTCAGDKPLTLDKYHYGGMAFRGNTQWVKEKGDKSIEPGDLEYSTSNGKNRFDGNHTPVDWVSFSGKVDGKPASVTVFGSPKNFRAPQHVRIHPDKPYFCFAPMVTGEFSIKPGDRYVSRYRYLVTGAKPATDQIQKHWEEYQASE